MAKVVSSKVTHHKGKYTARILFSFEYESVRTLILEFDLDDNYGNLSSEDQNLILSTRVQACLRELSQESTKARAYEYLLW